MPGVTAAVFVPVGLDAALLPSHLVLAEPRPTAHSPFRTGYRSLDNRVGCSRREDLRRRLARPETRVDPGTSLRRDQGEHGPRLTGGSN